MRYLPHDEEAFSKKEHRYNYEKSDYHPWLIHRKIKIDTKNRKDSGQPQKKIGLFRDARGWHVDLPEDICPPEYSMMHMVIVPSTGGQTVFASARKAYEMLSDEQKAQAAQLIVKPLSPMMFVSPGLQGYLGTKKNGLEWLDETAAKIDEVLTPEEQDHATCHPLVVVDPDTGDKSLFITPFTLNNFIGMESKETRN